MHPYKRLPDRNFWARAVANVPWQDMFKHERAKFIIGRDEVVSSAGSCFAQRIAQQFHKLGYNFPNFEPPHPLMSPEDAQSFGYTTASARLGNVYTVRELRQIVEQVFALTEGKFIIRPNRDDRWVDLLRPGVQKIGFGSYEEAFADRLHHMLRVREMLMASNVFVFTLGLTECWIDDDTGTVFGIHPEVALGRETDVQVSRLNLDYEACLRDLNFVIAQLRSVNPTLKFVFTVSPVALAATHQDRHVLLSTSYSKSVLRAVAGKVCDEHDFADYFMSYEIFNAAQSFGQYLSEDLRDISPRGLGTVMDTFSRVFLGQGQGNGDPSAALAPEPSGIPMPSTPASTHPPDLAAIECEEAMNALFAESTKATAPPIAPPSADSSRDGPQPAPTIMAT